MGDAAGETLTLEQVTQIISQAKAGGANPLLIGMQIFNTLGDSVTVTGDILKAAFTSSAIPIPGPLVPLLDAVRSVAKTGNHLSIALDQDIETTFNNNRLKFKQEMSFDAIPTPSAPALHNITGVAAHKLVSWITIQSIQLKQNLGRWSVAVATSLTTVNFDLK
jgi:hypothetical protein